MTTTTQDREPLFPWRQAVLPPTRLGRIRVGPVVIDGSFVLLVAGIVACGLFLIPGSTPADLGWNIAIVSVLVALPLLGLLHELGHIVAARLFGYEIHSLRFSFWTLGVDWGRDSQDVDCSHLVWICLAGPGTDLAIAITAISMFVFTDVWHPIWPGVILMATLSGVGNAWPWLKPGKEMSNPHPVVGAGQPSDGYWARAAWRYARNPS